MMRRRGKLTDNQIAAILQDEVSRSAGSDLEGGQLVANRERATDYILGRNGGGSPPEGTSKYVSHDVGDSIDALLGELLPSFSGDVVARFEENGPNDQTAMIESDVVSEFIMDRNPGVNILHNAIFSALAYKNGIVKVWMDERTESIPRQFPDPQTAATAAAIAESNGYDVTLDGDTITVTGTTQKLCIEDIDPDHFLYAANHRSIFLDGIRFCGEICYYTRSELVEMGVPKTKIRKMSHSGPEYKADTTAKRVGGATAWNDSQTYDQDEIRCISCYRYMPRNLNGDNLESDLYWFLYSFENNMVLMKERAEFIPYAAGYAWGMPGRFEGISVYDKLAPIQDAKSDAIRQILENLRAANNGKTAHNERIDPDDVLNMRAAATIGVEGQGPVQDAIMQLGATDILSQGLAFVQYLDGVRSERIGASLDLSSPEFQVASDTAHGTERVMSAREVRAGKNALMLSETLIRSLWLLVHKTLRRQWQGTIPANVRGQWIEVDPSQWQERDRVNITHGMSPGERARKGQALGVVISQQAAMMQNGLAGILTDPQRLYNTVVDQARCMGLEAPERHYIDPSSPEAIKAAQQQAQQAQEQAQLDQQLKVLLMRMEALDRSLKQQELRFKYFEANLDSQTELAKADLSGVVNLETAAIAADTQMANANNGANSQAD